MRRLDGSPSRSSTIRRRAILAVALLLIALAGVIGTSMAPSYLERRWIAAVREPSERPWQVPDGGVKVAFPTAGGETLRGWFLSAVAPATGITLLVMHGNFGVLPDYLPIAQSLRRRGFDILLFNYRGFGMSDGRVLDEASLDVDAVAALHYLVNGRGIDPHSTAFVGVSLGAPVAAYLAARSRCRALVLFSAITSGRNQLQRVKPWLPDFLLKVYDSFDTTDVIDEAKCPVLLVHGASDTVVTLSRIQELFDAAPTPKRLIVVPDAAHHLLGIDESYIDGLASFVINGR
jgi:pimeloyl-ACP methyl ester carboxylesterase